MKAIGFVLLHLAIWLAVSADSVAKAQPNVLLFFVDDMGYGELGCYGSKDLHTPHIDSIAENGVRCTAGYVTAPSCSPSRAGLLSGQYQQRFGHEINPDREFREVFGLNRNIKTIGDRMQTARYRTGAVGKWDLGRQVEDNPIRRGFDFYYGHIVGARPYWPLNRGPDHLVVSRGPDDFVRETRYLTYQLTDGALEFINTYRNDPFLLYVAYNAPHVPFQAPEEAISRNSHIESDTRRTYAGMITALDDSVGRILKKLRDLDLEEDTAIFFVSDNGSPAGARMCRGYTDENNLPLRAGKGTLYEGGIRVPYIVQWKAGRLPSGTTYDRPVSTLDLVPTALAISGIASPANLPGVNILPYLKGEKPDEDPVDVLYWRYKGARAVRAGDWKWVSDPKEGSGLFDLSKDLGEQNNLTQSDPERAAELESLWRRWNRDNMAPLWQTKGLEMMRRAYGGEGMKAAPERRQRQGQPNKASVPSDAQRSGRTADQSQEFKIDVFADHTDQWTGKRNTVWNSWYSHQAHGYAFLRDPDAWMTERWNPGELKNVRIMGGLKDPTKHRWMLGVRDGEPVCDFTGLIEILGAELAQGLKPGIVLDEVPWEIAVRVAPGPPSAKTMKYWNPKYGNDGPPADYDLWKKYVKQFLKACIDAFGYEEVSSWQYRVTTEPDNDRHWGGTWEEYIVHYDHTVQAVTEVIPNAWIGPGNFIASWLASGGNEHQLGTVEDFVRHCARGKNYATGEVGTRMTFLAFSVYSISTGPQPNENTFGHELAFKKAREILDSHPELNRYLDNDAMPEWFAIEVHEYGDLPSLAGEYLWMTEWMAGYHAHVLDLAYNQYGIYKTSFWFQNQGYGQWYPYIRVCQMLAEMEDGTLAEVRKNTVSESEKVKYGAISAWKGGSLYVLIYNFNWDPLHQGTLRGKRTHTIDNTITLNISGKSIAAHPRWKLDHEIINEKGGNACWYYDLKAELDMHPDLDVREGNYHVRIPRQRWKGPVEEIMFSRGTYTDNGIYDKYERLSEIGIVGADIPVNCSDGRITFTSEPFTQSGVQLLKFTPVR